MKWRRTWFTKAHDFLQPGDSEPLAAPRQHQYETRAEWRREARLWMVEREYESRHKQTHADAWWERRRSKLQYELASVNANELRERGRERGSKFQYFLSSLSQAEISDLESMRTIVWWEESIPTNLWTDFFIRNQGWWFNLNLAKVGETWHRVLTPWTRGRIRTSGLNKPLLLAPLWNNEEVHFHLARILIHE